MDMQRARRKAAQISGLVQGMEPAEFMLAMDVVYASLIKNLVKEEDREGLIQTHVRSVREMLAMLK